MEPEPQLSVIIPVWNGEDEIQGVLGALAAQDVPSDRFEVIVVDNGSTDGTAEAAKRYPFARVLHEARPGSYAARNLAIRKAAGRFLLFTDADCIPASNWVRKALEFAEQHGPRTLVGGRVEIFRLPEAGPYSSRYDQLTAGFNQKWNIENRMCITANWLCSKAMLERVGLFNPSLLSGGDCDCAGRLADAGYSLIYEHDLAVKHPTRASFRELIKKKRRVIGGRWLREQQDRTLTGFSRRVFTEYLNQARWVKNSEIEPNYKPGVIAIVVALWASVQLELVRLRLGGTPSRG